NEGTDFENSCMFLGEAESNFHMNRTHGWLKKGTPAKTTVPASKSITIIILDVISSVGVIGVYLRKL
ncbi:hypothetical protein EDC96DRAFT_412580, partial [Choanephora cucurbitarum]